MRRCGLLVVAVAVATLVVGCGDDDDDDGGGGASTEAEGPSQVEAVVEELADAIDRVAGIGRSTEVPCPPGGWSLEVTHQVSVGTIQDGDVVFCPSTVVTATGEVAVRVQNGGETPLTLGLRVAGLVDSLEPGEWTDVLLPGAAPGTSYSVPFSFSGTSLVISALEELLPSPGPQLPFLGCFRDGFSLGCVVDGIADLPLGTVQVGRLRVDLDVLADAVGIVFDAASVASRLDRLDPVGGTLTVAVAGS